MSSGESAEGRTDHDLDKKAQMARQTRAKHEILTKYLRKWVPILGRNHDVLLYVDGFSFTGRYTEGDGDGGDGSPLIALKCFQESGGSLGDTRGELIFIDKDPRVIARLKANVEGFPHRRKNDSIEYRQGPFATEVIPYIERLEHAEKSRRHRNIPAFFLVDPYGISGYPLELLNRILRLPSTEVFINVMWIRTEFNLHKKDIEDHFDLLFGTSDWRGLRGLPTSARRRQFLELYVQRLKAADGAGARFVRTFELHDKNGNLAYWLVFATNNPTGLEKMKEAMWDVDPSGNFHYYDVGAPGQEDLLLDSAVGHEVDLKKRLWQHFKDKREVPFAEISDFVLEHTPYLPKRHLKRAVMTPMEKEGEIRTYRPKGKRGWNEDTLVTWIPRGQLTLF